ncbi:MAG: calcium-binding protein, partial [Tateyamaria sp.]
AEAEDDDGQLLIGTIDDDSITGGEGDDDIIGLLGNDTLDGGPGGNDVIQGLNGDDLIIGGEGNDAMQGRGDNDTVQGFAGDDWVDGNDGNDVVRGGVGSDVAIGGQGEDTVDGRSGNDIVIGGEFNADPLSTDELGILRDGGTVDDIFADVTPPAAEIRDDGAADQLLGGRGSDLLILGAGDVATGGNEIDAFAVISDNGDSEIGPATITDFNNPEGESIALYFRADETVNGDAITVTDDGDDAVISYEGEILAVVTGAAGALSAADIGILQPEDSSTTPEITGTDDADTLSGTAADELINGLGGNDLLEGGAGDDEIIGGDGSDIIQGQAGFDRITGNADNDFLQGRGGDDTLSGNAGEDWVNGNDGNDSVRGGTSADTVIGGDGEDTVVGGEGADLLFGGELTEGPLFNGALAQLQAGASYDSVVSVGDANAFIPEDDLAADLIDGGNRDDQIIFGAADTVTGGAENDTFFALGSSAGADGGPGLITDYTAGEDTLVVMTDILTPVITIVNDGADALVLLNGENVMRIQGGAGSVAVTDILLSRGLDLTTI